MEKVYKLTSMPVQSALSDQQDTRVMQVGRT